MAERIPTEASADTRTHRFPCPQCGADVVWHPGAARLRCDYCGHVREVAPSDDPSVRERPLEQELARPRELGWGTARKSYRCTRCGAVESLEPGVAAGACDFCGTPAVVEAPPRDDLVRPAGVLPFRVTRHTALASFRAWLGSLWFRPNNLPARAEIESVHGVYIPFWTFDAVTLSRWRAQAGTRRGFGKRQRIDWRWTSGTLEHLFDDLPVPASGGLDRGLARRLEPFPTGELVPYEPSYLAGFAAEEHAVPLEAAWREARGRMESTLRAACKAEVPGQLVRNLQVETSWSALACKSGLLPVWLAAYEYSGQSYAYAVNGATGEAAGDAPWSWWKIGLALAAAAIVLLVLFSLG
jgi:DNA-directed RNA polymerase subunit RPC12/RpoP